MKLLDIPAGTGVFVDANILIFALTNYPAHGSACDAFLDRVENQEVVAVTSTHVLGEVVHRMMTIEAADRFGWPVKGIANRLRRHPVEVQQLVRSKQALAEIDAAGVSSLAVMPAHVPQAATISQQLGLLYGDALTVALMRHHGFSHLASLDADFDRVPGITRYSPA